MGEDFLLYHGMTSANLVSFNGIKRKRLLKCVTDPELALQISERQAYGQKCRIERQEQETKTAADYLATVIVLPGAERYEPTPPTHLNNWWVINLYRHPIDRDSEDVHILIEPSLDEILEVNGLQ